MRGSVMLRWANMGETYASDIVDCLRTMPWSLGTGRTSKQGSYMRITARLREQRPVNRHARDRPCS